MSSRRRRRLLARSGWTPAQLGATVLGWWKTGATGKYTDTGMTTPAAAGQAVAAWADASGQSLHVTQGTGAAQPVLQADGTLLFDGTDDFLDHLSSVGLANGTTPGEIFIVVNSTETGATTRHVISYGGGNAQTRRTFQRSQSSAVSRLSAIIGDNSTSVNAIHTSVVFEGWHWGWLRVNTTQTTISADGTTAVNASVTVNTGTTRIRIGCSTSSGNFWAGNISEVIVTGLLSTTQRFQMFNYMRQQASKFQ